MREVLVSEVGLRDGLQSIAAVVPTAASKAWIDAEAAALPQFAGTAASVAHARTIPGPSVAVLVRGAPAAGAVLPPGWRNAA